MNRTVDPPFRSAGLNKRQTAVQGLSVHIRTFKILRVIRRIPRAWLREMAEPIFNRGEVLKFLIAVIGLWLLLRTATMTERDMLARDWGVGVGAFAIAMVIWAIVSAIRVPFIVVRQDHEKGQWHGSRFVYHRPQLVAVERCVATGKLERFKIRFDDAEPYSFVSVEIEVEHKFVLPRMFVAVFTDVWLRPKYGEPHLKSGMSLPKDRTAYLAVQMMPETLSQTIRVYMVEWSLGNPNDRDGLANRPHKVGRAPLPR